MIVNEQKEYWVEKVADLSHYTEGPVMDQVGNLYCTTLAGGKILKIDPANVVSEFATATCPNGQFIAENGSHLVCESSLGRIDKYSRDGGFIGAVVDGFCNGVKVHCPNDLILDATGNIYYTDSIRYEGKLCFVGFNGRETVLAPGLDYPNGLILSQDQKILYLAESFQNRILTFPLLEPGVVGDRGVLIDLPCHPSGKENENLPDGLTLDREGNIWVAHYGMGAIHKISAAGKCLFSIDIGMPLASNLIFMDHRTIAVTGGYGEPGPGAVLKVHLR